MRRHNRLGLAGFAAVAAAVLAAAGCSSSSSSSSAAGTATSAAQASSLPASTGTGGQGAQSVTNYLTYTGGKAGPADKSLPPVYIGYVNQQGGPTAVGLLATAGAQMAVNYANAELGGVGGHPIQLVTCFIASAEEEGTVCAQKFLANKKVNVIELGGVTADRAQQIEVAGANEQHVHLGGVEHVRQLFALGPEVQRHEAGAQAGTGVIHLDELGRVSCHNANTAALSDTVGLERIRQAEDARSHLLIGNARLAIAGDQRFAVGQHGAADREELSRVHCSNLRLSWLPLKRLGHHTDKR